MIRQVIEREEAQVEQVIGEEAGGGGLKGEF